MIREQARLQIAHRRLIKRNRRSPSAASRLGLLGSLRQNANKRAEQIQMNFLCKFMLNSLRRGEDKCVVLMMNGQLRLTKGSRERTIKDFTTVSSFFHDSRAWAFHYSFHVSRASRWTCVSGSATRCLRRAQHILETLMAARPKVNKLNSLLAFAK
jgi:hypothetical protein